MATDGRHVFRLTEPIRFAWHSSSKDSDGRSLHAYPATPVALVALPGPSDLGLPFTPMVIQKCSEFVTRAGKGLLPFWRVLADARREVCGGYPVEDCSSGTFVRHLRLPARTSLPLVPAVMLAAWCSCAAKQAAVALCTCCARCKFHSLPFELRKAGLIPGAGDAVLVQLGSSAVMEGKSGSELSHCFSSGVVPMECGGNRCKRSHSRRQRQARHCFI